MKNFISLVCAMEFIEQNFEERITVNDVAQASYVSLSHLQSMFSRAFHMSVGDYVAKRKLCAAAFELLNTTKGVTDIAFDFGYANVESFTRAFKKQFLQSPSAYRKEHHFSELYPRLIINEKEGFSMAKRYDLTEISEKILASKGTYIICADIDHLMAINEQRGRDAGDAAIAETAARISRSVQNGTDFFRIGADHFVILTQSTDSVMAEETAKKIISCSEDDVVWAGEPFKFSISMGIVKIPSDSSDAKETIEKSENAMIEAKKEGRNSYKVI